MADPKFKVGDKVAVEGPYIDAVVTRLIKKGRGKKPALYQIEYTVDDEYTIDGQVERHSQPWFEDEISSR